MFMPYNSIEDLRIALTSARLIELTDDVGSGLVDEAVAAAAGSAAQNEIDPYLASRYPLPLALVPGIIKETSIALCAYWLYRRRMNEVPKRIATDRENAIRLLDHIREGTVPLDVMESSTIMCNKTAGDRMFPKSVLDQF
jgi:phage gp36-like protein